MTGGSDDARASDDGHNSVDAAWDELIVESEKDDEGARQADAPRAVSVGQVSAPRPDADEVMARLMAGEAPKLPTLDPESTKIVVQEVASTDAPKVVVRDEPVAEPAAVAAAAPSKPVIPREEPATAARASRPSLRVLDVAPVPTQPREADDRARASRPLEPPPPTTPAPTPSRGLPWVWIGLAAIAVGAVAYVVVTRDPKPKPVSGGSRDQAIVAPPHEPSPRAPMKPDADSSTPQGSDASDSDPGTDAGTDDSDDTGEPKPPKSRKDPREPPPGTPPEIAAVFRRLPVGPADRPPVGGIGATGIHIDHIAMGTETQGATCRGRTDHFSVSGGDRAGVCVRVVHSREKEELQVLWQKHGGSARRSKMVVLPMHAYRTRGYLVLRSEYIGDWTVRILSSDGVELARHDFTVDP